jgi:hypothetical protein
LYSLIRALSPVFVQVTVTGKADRIIAERAQRQRKEAKLATRRSAYKDSLDQVLEEERTALMRKHAMMSASTTHSHGTGYSRGNTTAGSTGAPMTPAALAAMTGSNVLMS